MKCACHCIKTLVSIDSANITYVKWDMNRQLTDIGSYGLPADRQGELYHRYVLAVYQMQDRLTKVFVTSSSYPNVPASATMPRVSNGVERPTA